MFKARDKSYLWISRLLDVSSPKIKSFPFVVEFLGEPMTAEFICKAPITVRAAINTEFLYDMIELRYTPY